MYEVFNMGCGFVCVVAAADAGAVRLLRGTTRRERIGTSPTAPAWSSADD